MLLDRLYVPYGDPNCHGVGALGRGIGLGFCNMDERQEVMGYQSYSCPWHWSSGSARRLWELLGLWVFLMLRHRYGLRLWLLVLHLWPPGWTS